MISLYDIEQFYRKHGTANGLKLSEDESGVLDAETGEYICSIETYLQYLREKNHCDFEEIWGCHATLQSTLRCRNCGTVIFASDDCWDYDPKLACPTCGGYDTHFEFWTQEQIDNDPVKKDSIQWMLDDTKRQNEEYERMKKRGGLYDWQRFIKKFRFKKFMLQISHICWGWGEKGRKKDRYLEISKWVRNENDMYEHGGKGSWTIKIPLNPYAAYLLWIFPRTKEYREARKTLSPQR